MTDCGPGRLLDRETDLDTMRAGAHGMGWSLATWHGMAGVYSMEALEVSIGLNTLRAE